MSQHQAVGLSRKQIRIMAYKVRKIFGIDGYYFPIVELLDIVMPQLDEKFSLYIVEKDELPPGHYAITYPDK